MKNELLNTSRMIKNVNLLSGYNLNGSAKRKTRKIDKNLREMVWIKYSKGSPTGKCYCCRRPITYFDFEVGHNRARATGGKDNIKNLRAICKKCNRSMGTMSIEVYKSKHFGTDKKKNKTTKKKSARKKGKRDNYYGITNFRIS